MRQTIAFLLCSVFVVTAVSGYAASDTRYEILQDKVERLEKDVSSLNRKVYRGEVGSKPAAPTATGTMGSLDDLYAQIAAQNEVVQSLTAKIETLEYNQKQLEDRLNKMNADVDMRFSMAEKTTSGASKDTTKSIPSNTSKVPAKEAYDKAYNAMKKGDYKTAESGFTAFMKNYPESDLVGNANYWLGETYYAREMYEEAAGIFADGFTKYKKNSKAADNLLKLGLTMNRLGKKQDACTAFNALPTEFPKAAQTLKNRAKAEAKKLSCK